MLRKIRSQEDVIFLFFIIVLLIVGVYIVLDGCLIDCFYFMVMLFYFCRFLRIKRSGK